MDTEMMAGPASGSGRWHTIPQPCHDFSIALAASPRGTVALGCGSEPGAGQENKRVWLSGNGGRSWRPLAGLPIAGYLGQISVTASGTVMVSGGRSDVYITWDGGKTWHTSPSLNGADIGDGLAATMFTSERGFVLQANVSVPQVWFTYNGGRTWAPVTVR